MRPRYTWLIAPLLGLVPTLAIAQAADPALARGHLAFDDRRPRLVVKLAPDCPPGTTVTRDGFGLGPMEFNVPIPVEVGPHVIMARGGGFQRRYDLFIAEGETKDVVVTPVGGEPLAMIAPTPFGSTMPPPAWPYGSAPIGWSASSQTSHDSPGRSQRFAGLGLIGVGAVGFVIGTIFGTKVLSKNDEIDSICPTGQPCAPQSVIEYNSAAAEAKIDRAVSLLSFGVGAVFVGTGAVLVLTAPRRQTPGMAVWVMPAVGSSMPGAALGGIW
jgi:hypothetical protein